MYKSVVVTAPRGKSHYECDIDFLAEAIQTASNSLLAEGFEVVSVVPVTKGVVDLNLAVGSSGCSVTYGAILTGKSSGSGPAAPPRSP